MWSCEFVSKDAGSHFVFVLSHRIGFFNKLKLRPSMRAKGFSIKVVGPADQLEPVLSVIKNLTWHKPVFYFAKVKSVDLGRVLAELNKCKSYEETMALSIWEITDFFEPLDSEIILYPESGHR